VTPEQTAPWMRLYVSLMTNDATHTVTTVGVLAAFHGIVTALWAFAGPRLLEILSDAIDSVQGPGGA